jgi:hypothetical protein
MTDEKVPHSELGDNLRDEAAKLTSPHSSELKNRLEVLAAWADNQVQWFKDFIAGNESLHQKVRELEMEVEHLRGGGQESDGFRTLIKISREHADKLDRVNELIKPQWRSVEYDRNALLDDLRKAVGMNIVSTQEEVPDE